MPRLENGQELPTLTASDLDGDDLTLPDDVKGMWTILLFYRGHW